MRKLLTAAAALSLLAGTGLALGEDMYPQGCVDCHVNADGNDMRISTLLENVGHMGVEDLETIPTDCKDCHSEDGGFGELYTFIHSAHYAGADNKFVVDHEGKCTHCHALDADSGEVSTKSGPKNW